MRHGGRLCAVVVAGERRTAIAGDEARGIETGGAIAADLSHRQADPRLNPRQEDMAGPLGVLLIETDRTLVDSHSTLLSLGSDGSFLANHADRQIQSMSVFA